LSRTEEKETETGLQTQIVSLYSQEQQQQQQAMKASIRFRLPPQATLSIPPPSLPSNLSVVQSSTPTLTSTPTPTPTPTPTLTPSSKVTARSNRIIKTIILGNSCHLLKAFISPFIFLSLSLFLSFSHRNFLISISFSIFFIR
jgi:hypothetical protein